jgi:hypothetical protein
MLCLQRLLTQAREVSCFFWISDEKTMRGWKNVLHEKKLTTKTTFVVYYKCSGFGAMD